MDNRITEITQAIGISRLANLTGLDRLGYPVVAAIRPLSKNLSVSFGKGDTVQSAQLSAVMEAAELYYSEKSPTPLRTATFAELGPANAISPATLEPLDAGSDLTAAAFHWSEGFDLQTRQKVLLPWEVVSMDFSCEARGQPRLLQFGATGLAAGFDETRAILHGLYEVIERDSHNRWNNLEHEQRALTRLAPEAIYDAGVQSVLAKITNAKLEVMLWDMTGPNSIPCYLAEVFDLSPHATTAYVQGAAAAISHHQALHKAIAEALQVRLTYIAGSRDDLDWCDYGERYAEIVENRRWLLSKPQVCKRSLPDTPQFKTVAMELKIVAKRLQQSGSGQIAVLRLTPAESLVAVVKVVMPNFVDTPDVDDFVQSAAGKNQVLA